MLKEFKQFLMRGNVMDLAVGVIIGAAFTAIVTSVVQNLISPLIAILTNSVSLATLKFSIGPATFNYGLVLDAIINFIITGFIIFLIVKFVNKLSKNKKKEESQVNTELSVLTEIRDLLQKDSKK